MHWRLGLGLVVVAGCGPRGAFACAEASDCAGGDAPGVCEPSGWCSFADAACPSGRRYGRWAGDALADTCVPPSDPAASTDATTDAGATSGDTGAPGTSSSSSSDDGTSSTAAASSDTGSSGGDIPAELVAWYRFETAIDGVVVDEQGVHDGTCDAAACPQIEPAIVGNGARFDGIDDVVRLVDHPDFHTDTGVTLAAWIAVDPMVLDFRCVIAKPLAIDSYADSWELARPDPGLASMGVGTIDVDGAAYAPLDESGWRHVAGTWDGSEVRLYVDGVLASTEPIGAIAFTQLDVYVGASLDLGAPTNFFAGVIDELRIYRGALGPDEIAALTR